MQQTISRNLKHGNTYWCGSSDTLNIYNLINYARDRYTTYLNRTRGEIVINQLAREMHFNGQNLRLGYLHSTLSQSRFEYDKSYRGLTARDKTQFIPTYNPSDATSLKKRLKILQR